VKPGRRAVGIAASDRERLSHLAGAVVRADRVADGFAFGTCTVGGSDATAAVCALIDQLDREDVRYVLLAGIAPAWFNILDLQTIHEHTGLPTLSVSFESSPGLGDAICDAFDSQAAVEKRLSTYRAQPDRRRLSVNDESLFVRSAGIDHETAAEIVRAYTAAGGRPEPLRIARLAARAVAASQTRCHSSN
jgi:endonuclease V-like protein UPF0215 family